MYTCIHVYMYTCMDIYIYIHIDMYLYIFISNTYICLDIAKVIGLIRAGPSHQEEILEEPPDLSQYPLMVDLVKHAGHWSELLAGKGCTSNLETSILWDLGKIDVFGVWRFEIWDIQIDVRGGSVAFSQRCNQKEGEMKHQSWASKVHEDFIRMKKKDQGGKAHTGFYGIYSFIYEIFRYFNGDF